MLNPELLFDGRPVTEVAKSTLLDPLADAVQPIIRQLRDANPVAKSLLAGTWLGHSLHPIVTDIPIGAFTVLAALDTTELLGTLDVVDASDLTLGLAIASSYGAVITGWADWADTHDEPRRVGLAHALLNGVSLIAYQGSFVLRKTGRRRLGIALGFAAYACMSAAAYFGGELTTGMHLGVRHTATGIAPPEEFVDVAASNDVPDEGWLRVEAGGVPMLLTRHAGALHAIGAVCTHRGAPLEEGTRENDCIRCPWHGARFSMSDGSVLEGPATFPLPRFEVKVEDDRVLVRAG